MSPAGFAPEVRSVVAVDATQAMLDHGWIEARRGAAQRRVHAGRRRRAPVRWTAAFDVVVSRFALHHFEDPRCRSPRCAACCARGGRLAVADLVADPDPKIAETQNHLERLRDPSHTRMLPLDELAALVRGSDVEFRDAERSLEPWLAQTQTPARRPPTRSAPRSRAELEGGAPTGFRPRDVHGDPRFLHTMASVIG